MKRMCRNINSRQKRVRSMALPISNSLAAVLLRLCVNYASVGFSAAALPQLADEQPFKVYGTAYKAGLSRPPTPQDAWAAAPSPKLNMTQVWNPLHVPLVTAELQLLKIRPGVISFGLAAHDLSICHLQVLAVCRRTDGFKMSLFTEHNLWPAAARKQQPHLHHQGHANAWPAGAGLGFSKQGSRGEPVTL